MKIVYHRPEDVKNYDEDKFFNSLNRYGEVSRETIREAVSKISYDPCHVSVLRNLGVQLLPDDESARRYYDEHSDYKLDKFNRICRITGYITSSVDTWNDAKKDELKARVKHSITSVERKDKTLQELEAEQGKVAEQNRMLKDIIDNLPYPAWLRDDQLHLRLVNKRYLDFVPPNSSKDDVINQGIEINSSNNESVSKELSKTAQSTIRPKRQKVTLVKNGERRAFEVAISPFHAEQSLDKIYSVGAMVDVTELDELKRNLKQHQNSHLRILGALGTAFAVFDAKKKLAFYNEAFSKIWNLDAAWLEKQPTYALFLDEIREKRLLPEVPDFTHYKNEEQNDFSKIIDAKEDLLHLPDGRTLRRVRAQYPMGGLLFAFEDITDRLATRRAYNDLVSVQKEILDNLPTGVAIFAPNGRLKLYNKELSEIWNAREIFLQNEPSIQELLESFKRFFTHVNDWNELKTDILTHLTNSTTKSFALVRNDGEEIEMASAELTDGSILVTCKKNTPAEVDAK